MSLTLAHDNLTLIVTEQPNCDLTVKTNDTHAGFSLISPLLLGFLGISAILHLFDSSNTSPLEMQACLELLLSTP